MGTPFWDCQQNRRGHANSATQVPASRLITSYPIPPQESFTCPPYSIRVRRTGSSDVIRYTFIATKDAASHKITLFKDLVHRDGKTTSTTKHQTLRTSSPQYITTATSSADSSALGEVFVVCKDGEVVGLSGETLTVQWTTASKPVVQEVSPAAIADFQVEFATSATLAELTEGIFSSRPEVFTALPKTTGTDPTFLIVVSRSSSKGQDNRHLLVLGISSGLNTTASEQQRLIPLDVAPIAQPSTPATGVSGYQVDVHSGLLLELQQGALIVYDLSGNVPKVKSITHMDGAQSFTRLSRPFVLSTSTDSIGLYNYQYRSVHGNTILDLSDLPGDVQNSQSCQLVTYIRSQDLVVALIDNVLVSIHVEPPKSQGRRRKAGLLIDSIGRGTAVEIPAKRFKSDKISVEFSKKVPGTMTDTYLANFHAGIEQADELLKTDNMSKWEETFRQKFGIGLQSNTSDQGSTLPSDIAKGQPTDGADSEGLLDWDWLLDPSLYPSVDRRWVTYAISRVFSAEVSEGEEPRLKLRLVLPDSNVTTYLALAGHLSLSNVKSAFREELEGDIAGGKHFSDDLVICLTEADASMTLLFNYLRSTKLGAVEILCAVRALMLSMDLIPDTTGASTRKLLKNVPHQEGEKDEMDLDDLEREIAITETYLGDESSIRSRGLTLAFMKLWRLPSRTTVQALRTALRTEEILSLIHLLRIELVQGAWTSLYVDPTSFDSEGNEPPPDGVIVLISDLLGRCIDAVGAGGWLVNDAMLGTDSPETGDFLTALKLEVTAALEGIEEAVYLNGIVGESVRYSLAAQKSGAARQSLSTNRPIPVHLESRESRMLPLGLKTKALPTKDKVVSGGEILQRSSRETGHLISRKVEAYSLEKLTI